MIECVKEAVNRYTPARIVGSVKHTNSIWSLLLNIGKEAEVFPGQFLMVWLPGYEEIPLSPSHVEDNIVRITVKAVGETTSKLVSLDIGDRVFIRGPYGRGFDLDVGGRYLLVGGGYGAAPIIYAARILKKRGKRLTYIEGVKTRSEKLFIDEASSFGIETVLVTEDGSSGVRGLVTEYVAKIIESYDVLLACGPEAMLNKLMGLCRGRKIRCQLSYERIVKCGIGLCGSCVLGDTGLLVCRDGPVFDVDTLLIHGGGRLYDRSGD